MNPSPNIVSNQQNAYPKQQQQNTSPQNQNNIPQQQYIPQNQQQSTGTPLQYNTPPGQTVSLQQQQHSVQQSPPVPQQYTVYTMQQNTTHRPDYPVVEHQQPTHTHTVIVPAQQYQSQPPPPPSVQYIQPQRTSADENKKLIFNICKIIVIIVCILSIAGPIIYWIYLLIFRFDWDWERGYYYFEYKSYGYWGFWEIITVVGLIGAAAEVMCCSLVYSVFTIWLFPYCIACWIVTIGICYGWNRPKSLIVIQRY